MSKVFSPSIIWSPALPPTAVWMTCLHVGRDDVPDGALSPVDRELQVRLPLDAEHAGVLHARHAGRACRLTCGAVASSSSRSGPKILTEFSPLTPESASMTLSRMFCEKSQSTPGKCCVELVVHLRRPVPAWSAAGRSSGSTGHSACGGMRDEDLDVVVAGRVGAVVGPADAGTIDRDLGELSKHRRAAGAPVRRPRRARR